MMRSAYCMEETGSLTSSLTLQHIPVHVVYTSVSSHVAKLLHSTDHWMDGFNLLSNAVSVLSK